MRKFIVILLLLTAVLCSAKYNVVGFSLSIVDGNTIAEILTDGPTEVKTISLENPDRLIIDLIGGVHRLKTTGLPPLPKSVVVEMRSAQFQADPKPITRIVLVLAEPVEISRVEDGPRSGKVIIPTPGYPDFEHWSVGRETPANGKPAEKPSAPTIEPKPAPEKALTPPSEGAEEPVETIESRPDSIAKMIEGDKEILTSMTERDAKGNEVTFVRPKVEYRGKEYRDPFVIAERRESSEFGSGSVPNVEGLSLVGIVRAGGGENLGILQDRNSWGYILGVGDSVMEGTVGEVTDSTIRFDIEEFGVIRPVNLELIKETN
ncbi:MAG: AMIN domain-containing protein [bacterium]